jgi:hypothetical protein
VTETRDSQVVGVIDVTPNLPNSPVVKTVIRFVERFYNEFQLDTERPSGVKIDSLMAFARVNKESVIKALREIKTDDSLILYGKKLPSDRDRFIGTDRALNTIPRQR